MTNYDILKEYEAHKTPVPSYKEYKTLKKQLVIAVEALTEIENSSKDVKAKSLVTQCVNNWLISHRTLMKIKELEK